MEDDERELSKRARRGSKYETPEKKGRDEKQSTKYRIDIDARPGCKQTREGRPMTVGRKARLWFVFDDDKMPSVDWVWAK